jgi:tryptophan 2,3-dioxygenase
MNSTKTNTVTYWDYLKLDRLLDLQSGLEINENQIDADEMHFIIVHQVFELWFRQMRRELKLINERMSASKVNESTIPFVVNHIDRINKILESAIKHFDVMETLSPQDFLQFRTRLGTASGFQSFQLREIEVLMGLQESDRKAQGHGNPVAFMLKSVAKDDSGFNSKIKEGLEDAQKGPSLRESLYKWLYRTPIQGSAPGQPGDEEIVDNFISGYMTGMEELNKQQVEQLCKDGSDKETIEKRFEASLHNIGDFMWAFDSPENERNQLRRIRAAVLFIESYREVPLLSWPRTLLDTIMQLEELFVGFRFRHARMVERVIGRRIGTGGSSGVDYLDQTVNYRIFKELWAVRTMLLPRTLRPPLKDPEFYGFNAENNS